jgi:hypothetical protein
MSKLLRWGLPIVVVALVLALVVRHHFVLDSRKFDPAIKTALPPGTPKALVIQFIQARKPLYWGDENYDSPKTRWVGSWAS